MKNHLLPALLLCLLSILCIQCTSDDGLDNCFKDNTGNVLLNGQSWEVEVMSQPSTRNASNITISFFQNHPNGNLKARLKVASIPQKIQTNVIQSTGINSDLFGVIPEYLLVGENGVTILEHYLYDKESEIISMVEVTGIDTENCFIEGSFNIALSEVTSQETIHFSQGYFKVEIPE